jgi:tetratricopeptide (TPR) repeat protein
VPAIGTGAHSVGTEQEARQIVRQLKAGGFDFIKIYNNVSRPVFDAIVDEGGKQGLSVIGHIPRDFDPLAALGSGQDVVAHTEELFFTYFDGPRNLDDMPGEYRPDYDKLPALIEVMKANSVAVMPDLSFTFGNLLMWDSLEHVWYDPEFAYLHPATAAMWCAGNINRREQVEKFIVRGQWKYELLQRLTLEFQKAGILQVIGTDASLASLFPGKSAHRELTELVKAGLSNYEALSVATSNAGELARRYLDPDVRFGQVLPGYRADLLLLEENPLDDVRNARAISGVVVSGRYLSAEALDEMRHGLLERYETLQQLIDDVEAAFGSVQPDDTIAALIQANSGDEEALGTIETQINAAGYAAGFGGDLDQAVTILEMNTRLFPLSANTWDSLAEVTLYLGERDRALELYNKVLVLDPSFPGAAEKVRELTNSTE